MSLGMYPTTAIKVPKRMRSTSVDVSDLVKSISEVGLLQPIAIGANGRLVAGYRRLKACIQLGMEKVPVILVENSKDLDEQELRNRKEFDENFVRKDFEPSELWTMAKQFFNEETEKAKERKLAGKANLGHNCVQGTREPRVADIVANKIGINRNQWNILVRCMKVFELTQDTMIIETLNSRTRCGWNWAGAKKYCDGKAYPTLREVNKH